jgi:hypothetical protein
MREVLLLLKFTRLRGTLRGYVIDSMIEIMNMRNKIQE